MYNLGYSASKKFKQNHPCQGPSSALPGLHHPTWSVDQDAADAQDWEPRWTGFIAQPLLSYEITACSILFLTYSGETAVVW
jgi:hypothetical protein